MKIQSLAWSLMLTALLGSLVFAQVPAGPARPSGLAQAKDCAAGRCWGEAPPEAVPVQGGGSISRGALTDAPPRPPANVGEKTSAIEKLSPEQREKWEKFAERQKTIQTGAATVAGGAMGLMLGTLLLGPLAPVGVLVALAAVGALAGCGFAAAAHRGAFSRGR